MLVAVYMIEETNYNIIMQILDLKSNLLEQFMGQFIQDYYFQK